MRNWKKLIKSGGRVGKPPKVFLIEAPRDEESKYLHEIYGILKEIDNSDVYIQNAKINSIIQRVTYYSITWNNEKKIVFIIY